MSLANLARDALSNWLARTAIFHSFRSARRLHPQSTTGSATMSSRTTSRWCWRERGRAVLSSQFSVLSSQFSVLGSRFSVLGSRFSVLSSQFSVLSSQFSVLSSQFSVLSSQFSVLSSAEGCVTPILDFLFLPAALLEQDCAGGGHGTFGDGNGCKSAIRVHVQRNRQPIGQGDLKQPESKKIYDGRGDRIARAIEGLHHYHKICVAEVPIAHDA